MASYALQRHLVWRTQSRLGQHVLVKFIPHIFYWTSIYTAWNFNKIVIWTFTTDDFMVFETEDIFI